MNILFHSVSSLIILVVETIDDKKCNCQGHNITDIDASIALNKVILYYDK